MQPRVIRLKNAPEYLGMNKNEFNEKVRPVLTEIPIGERGIGFDRIDLDAWLDEHKQRNGRCAVRSNDTWAKRERRVSTFDTASGRLTKLSEENEFAKALERANLKKRNTI